MVSPIAQPGGAEALFVAAARRLPALGFATEAVLFEEGPVEQSLAEAGVRVHLIPLARTRHLHRSLRAELRLTSLVRRVAPDVVLSNHAKGHLFGGVAARLARAPAIWWEHSIPHGDLRILRIAARVPTAAIVCYTDAALAALQQVAPRRAIHKVWGGIDVAAVAARRGSGRSVRERLGWERNPIVGIVGRLERWKGQDTFLRAAALIARGRPDVRFAVVGGAIFGTEGEYPAQLHALAASLGIADQVYFAGQQPDALPWFDASDVVVHASVDEPFGLVLVEAMALGRPLVASASAGPLEIVEDGRSGLLVAPGDHDAIARAVIRILDGRHLADTLGQGARARANEFTEERMANGLAEVMRSVLVLAGRDGR
jgi:glycosyltransferase involved in cell wall biosynthesis